MRRPEGFWTAVRYLTVLPTPYASSAGDLGAAAAWFPVVGLGLGAALALAWAGLARVGPPLLASALVVTLWVALTGALHLDGLADAADGLGGGWTPERALALMRDGRSGPFGVTAVVLVLGLKGAALASLPPSLGWRALLLAPVLGRGAPILLARLCPPARPEGAGRAFAAGARGRALATAVVVSVLTAVATLGAPGLAPVLLAGAGAWAFAAYLARRLGGVTGDCLGALVEATEAAVLAVAAGLGAWARA